VADRNLEKKINHQLQKSGLLQKFLALVSDMPEYTSANLVRQYLERYKHELFSPM